MLLISGCYILPGIETLAAYINGEVVNMTVNLPKKMYDFSSSRAENHAKELRSAMAALASGTSNDPELKAFLDQRAKESGTIGIISFDLECIEAAESQYKTLLPEEIVRIREIISESGAIDAKLKNSLNQKLTNFEVEKQITDNFNAFREANPDNFEAGDMTSEKPLWRKSFSELLAELFTFVGALLALIMKFLRTGILYLFRFALPIVVCLSFLPGEEDAWKKWWQNYKTLALMLVTFTIIESLSRMGWLATRAYAHVDGIATANAVMAFIIGIFYILSPTLTVMMFGGSQTMGSISGQIMGAGALMYGLTRSPAKTIMKDKVNEGESKAVSAAGGGSGGSGGGDRSITKVV
jgi:hypothetical protein